MKRFVRLFCVMAMLAVVSQANAQDLKSLLGGVLNSVVGDKATTESSIIGTWKYSAPQCQLTSENALMQAGGELASQKVEEKLLPIFNKVKIENMTVSFKADSTFAIGNSNKPLLNGTYTFDSTEKTVQLTSKMGFKATAYVTTNLNGTMGLTFAADKLLELLKKVSAVAATQSSTLSTINSLASNYKGVRLCFELKKQ
ncbi:MAG: DUF4923 family protein [Bacteroidales bacterium]|nr:DUF4923 family protein [Bacteroidales bacterium]